MKTAKIVTCWIVCLGCGGGGSASGPDAAGGDAASVDAGETLADATTKSCAGHTADVTDPTTGCARTSCEACPLPAGATALACSTSGECDHVCAPGLHKTATGCGPLALQIAASKSISTHDYTCAVTQQRTVRCWGVLDGPALGTALWDTPAPADVAGLDSVQQLAAGSGHMCAARSDGSVMCWGRNDAGQLGDGSTTSSSTPVAVVGLPAAAKAVSAGAAHSCAVLVTGDVWCWGSNRHFVLGRTTATDSGNPPGPIAYTNPSLTAVSSSAWHNCGLATNGHVLCWGANLSGELGNGVLSETSTPVEVAGIADAVAVVVGGIASSVSIGGTAASGGYSFAVRANGTVAAWGYKNIELGLGQGISRVTEPTTIPGLGAVIELAHGPGHVCATTSDGKAICWGHGEYGKLGAAGLAATNKLLFAPTHMADFGSGISHVAAGRSHTCMVYDAELRCVGNNFSGQLGNGTTSAYSAVPLQVAW